VSVGYLYTAGCTVDERVLVTDSGQIETSIGLLRSQIRCR